MANQLADRYADALCEILSARNSSYDWAIVQRGSVPRGATVIEMPKSDSARRRSSPESPSQESAMAIGSRAG